MPVLDTLVNIAITQDTLSVAQPSFATMLIVGPTQLSWADHVHTYTSPEAMLSDGFALGDPEYVFAAAAYAQTIAPVQFKVAKRGVETAQVDTFTVGAYTAGHAYKITIDGDQKTFTAPASGGDAAAVVAGLAAAIGSSGPVTAAVSGTGPTSALVLTAHVAGDAVTYTQIDPLLVRTATTPASGIVADIAAASAQDDDWYCLITPFADAEEIEQAFRYIEARKKIYVFAHNDPAAAEGATTDDVFSLLKAGAFKRSVGVYSDQGTLLGLPSAWAGSQLAQTPGSNNWAYCQLAGIPADKLTDSQRAALIGNPVAGVAGKNANVYTPIAGVNVTQMGTAGSGQFVDITVGIDWLESRIQTNVFGRLVAAKKIPYTDAGVAVVMSAVREAIDEGISNGLIDPESPVTITAPPVASVPQSRRAKRIAPPIDFACRLQGALNAVDVRGSVSV